MADSHPMCDLWAEKVSDEMSLLEAFKEWYYKRSFQTLLNENLFKVFLENSHSGFSFKELERERGRILDYIKAKEELLDEQRRLAASSGDDERE